MYYVIPMQEFQALEKLLQEVMYLAEIPEFRQVVFAQERHDNKRASWDIRDGDYFQARDYVIRWVALELRGGKALEYFDFIGPLSIAVGGNTKFEDDLGIVGESCGIQHFDGKSVPLVLAVMWDLSVCFPRGYPVLSVSRTELVPF